MYVCMYIFYVGTYIILYIGLLPHGFRPVMPAVCSWNTGLQYIPIYRMLYVLRAEGTLLTHRAYKTAAMLYARIAFVYNIFHAIYIRTVQC